VQADPIARGLHGLQRPTTASPVWIIVGNDGASGDDCVFALMSLVVWEVAVQCGGLELTVVLFFLLF
jgi:hypothetical protein